MGCYLTLIAFDEEPNLASVGGLLDYRLYKREGRSEWYLDSPDKRFPNFPLVQPPSIDRRNLGDAWTNAVQEYTWLVAETKRQDRDTFGLDYQLIPVALALSAALQTRLLAVSGNDEDLDCGFICARGRLVRGRFLTSEAEAMVFDVEHGARLAQLDWSEGRHFYGEGALIAADYFKAPDPLAYIQNWEDRAEHDFKLVAERSGAAQAKRAKARLGCAAVTVLFAALFAGFQLAPSIAYPVGGTLLGLAIIWYLWPARR